MKLWDYAVAVYALDGVQQRLLALQDRHGADVNVILWCLWCGREGIIMADKDVPQILASVNALTEQAVRPLRQVRRYLTSCREVSSADEIASLRKDVLALELRAEKLVLNALEEKTPVQRADTTTNPSMEQRAAHLFMLAAQHMDIAPGIDDENTTGSDGTLFRTILTLAKDHGP